MRNSLARGGQPELIVGKFNDISETASIHPDARICGYCFIGENVIIGKNSVIGNFCEINSGASIGSDVLINSHCNVNSDTVIGNGVIFGGGVLTADEKFMTSRTENAEKSPCIIGDDCRIGQNSSLICTNLGRCVSIGAGSVVLEPRIRDYEVWVGNPAKFLRMASEYEKSI